MRKSEYNKATPDATHLAHPSVQLLRLASILENRFHAVGSL